MKEKQSTKQCPKCGNKRLAEVRTHNVKYCMKCNVKIPWYLEPGQKTLL